MVATAGFEAIDQVGMGTKRAIAHANAAISRAMATTI
jgi:hypothetical protein